MLQNIMIMWSICIFYRLITDNLGLEQMNKKNLVKNRIWLSFCRWAAWAGPKDDDGLKINFFLSISFTIHKFKWFFSILEWYKLDSMKRRYGPYHWTESKSLSSSWNNPLDLNYIWRNIMDSTGGLYTIIQQVSTVHFLVSFCQPLKKST